MSVKQNKSVAMIYQDYVHVALCIKSPYSELFLSAFFPDFLAFGLNSCGTR